MTNNLAHEFKIGDFAYITTTTGVCVVQVVGGNDKELLIRTSIRADPKVLIPITNDKVRREMLAFDRVGDHRLPPALPPKKKLP